MSRTWTQWLARWKSNLGPNRRPIRRRSNRVVLSPERLETRATPAVIYGMGIGRPATTPPAGPVVIGDTLPPAITVTSAPGATVTSNPTITGRVTDNVQNGLTLTVKVDNQPLQSVALDATGAFSFTTTFATNGTANGPHTLTFFARDLAGNTATPAVVQFNLAAGNLTFDLDAASDTGVQGNHTTTLNSVTLSGTGPANQTITLVQTGATTTSDANGTYSFTNVNLASGANNFTVRTTTTAGDPIEFSRTIILDTAPSVAGAVSNFLVDVDAANTVLNLPTIFSDINVNSLVRFTTNRGTFDVELFDQQTALTVANFLKYVAGTTTSGGDYTNTIFHRKTTLATDGIGVLQGGGFEFTSDGTGGHLTHIPVDAAIALQAGLTNVRGTIAMARTGDPNSGTSEFFINTVDNRVLDPGGGADPNGYAVFGVVRGSGMDVVDASYATPTQNRGGAFASIPLQNYPPPPAGNFPTDTTAANYEIVTGSSIVRRPDVNAPDSLTFSVLSNSNTNLVSATVSNGRLILDYVAGQSGSATIRLGATDADGATAETEFTVTVGEDAADPIVTVTSPPNDQPFASNPTIQGTATDNFAVTSLEARVDGGAAQTVTVGPQGAFSFTPNVPTDGSAEGSHTVVFTASDGSGNTSDPVTFTFRMDNTAPAVTVTSPADGLTFTVSPQITGTVTDANGVSNLRASVDGGPPQAVAVDGQGNFTFTPAVDTEGPHSVAFTSQDVAGNQSAAVTITYTVAQTATVTITSPADGLSFTANPQITGSVANDIPDGGLEVSVDGGPAEVVPFDANRNFTFTPGPTTEGQHVVTFSAGAGFAPVTFNYRLDTVAPTVAVTSPPDGQTFAANPQITGQVAESQVLAELRASVDGGPAQTVQVDAQGGFTFTPTIATDGSANGPHTVTFVAKDAAGNESTPASVSFTLDSTAPAVAVTSPPSGSASTTSPTIVGTVSDNVAVTEFTVSVNGGPEQSLPVDAQGNFAFNPNLATDGSADGTYEYVFAARDAAGSVSLVTHLLFLDTTPPVATVTSPADGQVFSSNPTINVAVTDNVGSASANVFVDGVFVQEVLFPVNVGFSFTPALPTDGTANGQHTVTFVAKDVAVNESTPVTFTFTLETETPVVAVTSPANGTFVATSPTIVGTVSNSASVTGLTVSVNGGPDQAVPIDGQGGFTFNPNLATDGSADGTYQYVFIARGATGPVSTVTHTLILDTTPPVATVTSPADGQTFASNPTIDVSVTDNLGSGVADVFVDGVFDREVTFPTNTGFSYTPTLPTDGSANGSHLITFVAKDGAANQSTPVTFQFTLQP